MSKKQEEGESFDRRLYIILMNSYTHHHSLQFVLYFITVLLVNTFMMMKVTMVQEMMRTAST